MSQIRDVRKLLEKMEKEAAKTEERGLNMLQRAGQQRLHIQQVKNRLAESEIGKNPK